MPSLIAFQRGFRAAVLGGTPLPPGTVRAGRVDPDAALQVYRDNVVGNLTEALRLAFPAVDRLVGAAFFDHLAESFIRARPPQDADLYGYGAGFAAFLETVPAAAALAYLPDVARLEWAVNRAAHGPGAVALDPAALLAVPPERQSDLRLRLHPAASLLRLDHPARQIWEAVLTADAREKDRRMAGVDPNAGGERLVVHPGGDAPRIGVLSHAAFALAAALAAGTPLGPALRAAGSEDGAAILAGFLAESLFDAVSPTGGAACNGRGSHG